MKKALMLAVSVALVGFTQAITASWNNRYEGGVSWSDTWGDGKNTADTPVFALNTNTTTGTKVFTNTSGFQSNYLGAGSGAGLSSFDNISSPMKIASIVLCAGRNVSLPSTTRIMLKQGENTYISEAVVRSSGSDYVSWSADGKTQQSSGWRESFTFEDSVTLQEGMDYEVYFVSDTDGTLIDSLTYSFMMRDGILSFDVQLDCEAVPEPTALALLALGVAGLALQRKVA